MRLWRREAPVLRQPFDVDVDAVTSADGTTIGFRRYGAGPGLVLIHGGMNSAQDLGDLASLLSDAFTVLVPDRRGRGMSGPFGPATPSPSRSGTCGHYWIAPAPGSCSA